MKKIVSLLMVASFFSCFYSLSYGQEIGEKCKITEIKKNSPIKNIYISGNDDYLIEYDNNDKKIAEENGEELLKDKQINQIYGYSNENNIIYSLNSNYNQQQLYIGDKAFGDNYESIFFSPFIHGNFESNFYFEGKKEDDLRYLIKNGISGKKGFSKINNLIFSNDFKNYAYIGETDGGKFLVYNDQIIESSLSQQIELYKITNNGVTYSIGNEITMEGKKTTLNYTPLSIIKFSNDGKSYLFKTKIKDKYFLILNNKIYSEGYDELMSFFFDKENKIYFFYYSNNSFNLSKNGIIINANNYKVDIGYSGVNNGNVYFIIENNGTQFIVTEDNQIAGIGEIDPYDIHINTGDITIKSGRIFQTQQLISTKYGTGKPYIIISNLSITNNGHIYVGYNQNINPELIRNNVLLTNKFENYSFPIKINNVNNFYFSGEKDGSSYLLNIKCNSNYEEELIKIKTNYGKNKQVTQKFLKIDKINFSKYSKIQLEKLLSRIQKIKKSKNHPVLDYLEAKIWLEINSR